MIEPLEAGDNKEGRRTLIVARQTLAYDDHPVDC
jgi:hypothetical protein